MLLRLIASVIVFHIVSVGDFFSSQWVFKRRFTSYADEVCRDQVYD